MHFNSNTITPTTINAAIAGTPRLIAGAGKAFTAAKAGTETRTTAMPETMLFTTISVSSWNALNPAGISTQKTCQNDVVNIDGTKNRPGDCKRPLYAE